MVIIIGRIPDVCQLSSCIHGVYCDMKEKRFCVRINQEMRENRLLERLRVIAAKRKRSVSFLVREGLLQFLDREERKDLTVD